MKIGQPCKGVLGYIIGRPVITLGPIFVIAVRDREQQIPIGGIIVFAPLNTIGKIGNDDAIDSLLHRPDQIVLQVQFTSHVEITKQH